VIVFLSNFVAGLSGHEPLLVFVIGVLLVGLELVLFPGTVVMALTGILLMFGALLWSMADIWPNQPVVLSGDLLLVPLEKLLLGLLIAGGALLLIARFLPHGWIWDRLAVSGAVHGAGVSAATIGEMESLVGKTGVAATSLFPSGQVEIDGRRYEARLEVGFAEAGTPVRITRRTDFNLIVEISRRP
jgi:membrane-bound serine protease (ClpP class)